MTKKKVPEVKKPVPAAKKAAPAKNAAPAVKKVAAAPAVKKPAAPAPIKFKKGEALSFNKRNGEIGTGTYVETLNMGKGDWIVIKVEKGRNPVAKVRPTEVRRAA